MDLVQASISADGEGLDADGEPPSLWTADARLIVAAAFVTAFVLSWLFLFTAHIRVTGAVVWPVNACAVLFILRAGRTRAMDIALLAATWLGNALADFALGFGPAAYLLFPTWGGLEIISAVLLARWFAPLGLARLSPKRALLLSMLMAVVAPATTAILATAARIPGGLPKEGLVRVLLSWWSCNSLGLMIILPLGLTLHDPFLARLKTWRGRVEGAFCFVLVLASNLIVFQSASPLWSIVIAPSLVLTTFRFGLTGSAAATLLTTLVAVPLTTLGYGPIESAWRGSNLNVAFALQIFLGVCWLIAMPAGVMLESYSADLRRKERSLSLARLLASDAQNRMLRYQLNPHLLFNCLNALSTLIVEGDSRTADRMVITLSKFLRYCLEHDPDSAVALSRELEAQDRYLELERIRFGDRLIWRAEIAPEARDCLVPSLILQPLIENAVKHGVASTRKPVEIVLSAERAGDRVLVCVRDNGPGGATRPPGLGVGLENVRKRLELTYGGAATFSMGAKAPQGFEVRLSIPFRSVANAAPAQRTPSRAVRIRRPRQAAT